MPNLTDLNISINEIIELPSSFGELKRLQMLKADRNSLHNLTSEIGKCQSLTELYLGQNFLTVSEFFLILFQKLMKFHEKRYTDLISLPLKK